MPTKTKLEKAIEDGVSSLNDAQRQLVLAQFSDWKRNKARIVEIEDMLKLKKPGHDEQRCDLVNERAQLIDVNGRILARLSDQLSDRS